MKASYPKTFPCDRLPKGSASKVPDEENWMVGSIRRYFECFLPQLTGMGLVPGLARVDTKIRFRIETGEKLLSWEVEIAEGVILSIREGEKGKADIEYTLSPETFLRITAGEMRPEEAFLKGRIKVAGNILRALKMAMLLQSFFRDHPYRSDAEGLPRAETCLSSEEEPDTVPEGIVEERTSIPYGAGVLETTLCYPETGAPLWSIAVVPPHPFLGATSENRVVRGICRHLAAHGCLTARFDYTLSSGESNDEDSILDRFWSTSNTGDDLGARDLTTIWRWLQAQPMRPERGFCLIGYSYGAQVVLKFCREESPDRLVLISPVAPQIGQETRYAAAPTLLLTAENDFATSRKEYHLFRRTLPGLVSHQELSESDHFYRGKINQVSAEIESFLGFVRQDE